MKRLIVHVGMPKAGSKTIQTMLRNCTELLTANGVHVPTLSGTEHGGHGKLGRELVAAPRNPRLAWTQLAQQIRLTDATTFVISVEFFLQARFREIVAAKLAELVERENLAVGIVGYVRPQWQYLESWYTQAMYGGKSKWRAPTFQRFVADRLDGREPTMLDYNIAFAPYRAAFGEHVEVTPLEPSRLPQGLLVNFLRQCGVNATPAAVADLPRRNPRRGAKATEVQRLALAAFQPQPEGARRPLLLALPRLLDDDVPFAGFDPAQIADIEARFADANARFAREYDIDDDGKLFRDRTVADDPRPNIARWPEDFGAEERRAVRGHLLERQGFDIDPGADDKLFVMWHLARHKIRARLFGCRLHRRRRRSRTPAA